MKRNFVVSFQPPPSPEVLDMVVMRGSLAVAAAAFGLVHAQSSDGGTLATPVSVSTVVASPSASAGSTLPSQVTLPPKQEWCNSEFFCAGEVRRFFAILLAFSTVA